MQLAYNLSCILCKSSICDSHMHWQHSIYFCTDYFYSCLGVLESVNRSPLVHVYRLPCMKRRKHEFKRYSGSTVAKLFKFKTSSSVICTKCVLFISNMHACETILIPLTICEDCEQLKATTSCFYSSFQIVPVELRHRQIIIHVITPYLVWHIRSYIVLVFQTSFILYFICLEFWKYRKPRN